MNQRSRPVITIVVAMGENNSIGKDNQLLWHLPADLKHFKEITSGHTIIMGRKTFDSIGRALPNRKNIVISRQQSSFPEGVIHANDLTEALAMCAPEESVFIIGGGSIYEIALPLCDVIELTTVHRTFQADVFFPHFDTANWITTTAIRHEADEKNAFPYTFSRLVRS